MLSRHILSVRKNHSHKKIHIAFLYCLNIMLPIYSNFICHNGTKLNCFPMNTISINFHETKRRMPINLSIKSHENIVDEIIE